MIDGLYENKIITGIAPIIVCISLWAVELKKQRYMTTLEDVPIYIMLSGADKSMLTLIGDIIELSGIYPENRF